MNLVLGRVMLGLFLLSIQIPADVIFGNFTDGRAGGDIYSVGEPFFATTFLTAEAGELGTVYVPVYGSGPVMTPVIFGLYTSSGGQPGSLLESWNTPILAGDHDLTVLTSVPNVFLSAATPYWFVIQKPNVGVAWFGNAESELGGFWQGSSVNQLSQVYPDLPAPGLRLETPTPEPSSVILLGLGLLVALGCMPWKRMLKPCAFLLE